MIDNPKDRDTATDKSLNSDEKELRMVANNDDNHVRVSTEIPTFIKWLQSIPQSEFERVRTNDSGEITHATAIVPKGMVKLQAQARKSDTHSQMVSYGENL